MIAGRWIPAYAGMTGVGVRARRDGCGNDVGGCGNDGMGAGMTGGLQIYDV